MFGSPFLFHAHGCIHKSSTLTNSLKVLQPPILFRSFEFKLKSKIDSVTKKAFQMVRRRTSSAAQTVLPGSTTQIIPNTAKVVEAQGNMIGRPTVAVSDHAANKVIQSIETDPFFSIRVSTKDATEPQLVVLFDASQGYQMAYSQYNGPDVKIEGLSAGYQFILNDVSHNASYLDLLKMRVTDYNTDSNGNCCGTRASDQYARPIEIFDSSKGSRPRLLKTIYPEQGVHEGQYQLNINTFSNDIIITNRTAFVYMQEPGISISWGFYQVAELGRKQ